MRTKMRETIAHLISDESGSTAIEYALLAGGIFLAIVVSVNSLGNTLVNLFFNNIASAVR